MEVAPDKLNEVRKGFPEGLISKWSFMGGRAFQADGTNIKTWHTGHHKYFIMAGA